MKLGSFDIDIVQDGTFALDGGAMFGVVPRMLWERHFVPDERNRIRLGLNALLVRTGRENVLIDTGIGQKWDARARDIYSITHETNLMAELAKFGIAPEDIDIVINTHLHFDHCGTNTVEQAGRVIPAFPHARYIVQRGELEHARHPHERDRASYDPLNFEPIAEAGLFELVDGEAEIVPGIRVLKVGGHNRDFQCVRIDSQGQTAFAFADLVPTTAHIRPAWIMSFDLYPVETLEEKKRLTAQALSERWICVFYHDPKVPLGRLHESDGKIIVEPVS
jgi:glyoxylase-like metal-dependent hydrolase (beta-lactamase superfamily II)